MFIEKITGDLGDKKRWRQYKARAKALPEPYREAVAGIERYLMYFAPTSGENLIRMVEDLADLFEQGVADGTSVRGIVGDDPVQFVDDFVRNYNDGGWMRKQQDKLVEAIRRAEAAER